MKKVVYLLILAALTIGAYKLGLHNGTQAGNATAAQYSKLYDQAIMWQNHVIADLPKITTNPKLKEKTQ